MHFETRDLGYAHATRNAKQQDQGVALRESACYFGDAQKVTKLGGREDFGVFGFHAFLSRNTLEFGHRYERKSVGRSFSV